MLEQLLTLPGFLYHIDGRYYFLGKWICKECTDIDATDCVHMYSICRTAGEEQETGYYFQKLRAYSDLALEIPYNPALIRKNTEELLSSLSEALSNTLGEQITAFQEDLPKYS